MNRIGSMLIVALILLTAPSIPAQYYIELDGDGSLGGGPDTLSASWGRSCQRPEKETTAAHTPRRRATHSENCPRSVMGRYAFASS